MDAPLVEPPSLARPLRLSPFRARQLVAHRVALPTTTRILARPYREARRSLVRWERTGELTRAEQTALYVHEYSVDGVTVRGLVGALDLTRVAAAGDEPAVLPHEGIHPPRAAQLAARMVALDLNPAPILLVHRGPAAVRELLARTTSGVPLRAFADATGHKHRVWPVTDRAVLTQLAASLAESTPMIADGHHRYTAYLQLHRQRPGTGWDRGLAMLVDQDDTPLSLGPIHRTIVGASRARVEGAARALGWDVTPLDVADAKPPADPRDLVLADSRGASTVRLTLPTGEAAVDLLHDALLPPLGARVRRVAYHHAIEDALLDRRRGCVVLLPAPTFDVVYDLVAHRRLLPEKATSFQPKPPLGVLMRSVHDEADEPS